MEINQATQLKYYRIVGRTMVINDFRNKQTKEKKRMLLYFLLKDRLL